MSDLIRIQVDTERLTDEAFAFVTDPTPARNDRQIVQDLGDFYPEMVDVLECMVIDGTEARQDVSDYVHAVFTPEGYRSPEAPTRPVHRT
ncbi:MAG: hypothetical protein ACRDJH_13525 [Thermomicrobiales bacterium]